MPKLTSQAQRETIQNTRNALGRADRRIDKLQVDLEAIQWELNDLRDLRSVLTWALEQFEEEYNAGN